MFEARADGFSQLIGPLSKITVTHRKKEDTDDGENSKYDRERTGNKWCCKKGGQRQCERRQTEWQQNWNDKQPKQTHAEWTGTEATVGVLGKVLTTGATKRIQRRKVIRSIVATAQPAKLVAARAARHVIAAEMRTNNKKHM